MSDLGRRLRQLPLPGEAAARERARRTVLAAHAARPVARRRPLRALAAPLAAALLLLVCALTAPGQAVAEWLGVGGPARAVRDLVRDVVQPVPTPRPVPAHAAGGALPLGGRLLVAGARGAWVLDRAGAHRLGAWPAATWSPRGVYVAVTGGGALAAVDPAGRVHWRLARAHAADPRWAPDGTHVAYRSGRELRVVYGNGTHDRLLARRAAPVAPAWQPGAPHALAWAGRDGVVRITDADTGRELWHARGGHVTVLAWSADGRRLLAASPRGGRVHDVSAHRGAALRLARGQRLESAAWAPAGHVLALATRSRGRAQIALVGRRGPLFSAAGRLTGLVWSPDGRWLAADWPTASQWLLVRARGRPRVETVATTRGRGAAGRPQGWCCVG
jgi:WD40-like Beta Propeller Repeat